MRILVTCIFVLLGIGSNAQLRLKNHSSTKPDEKILYVGAENRIELVGLSGNKKYLLKSSSGEISEYPSFYIVGVKSAGNDTLTVFENGTRKLQEIFRKEDIPGPVVRIGRYSDTVLTKTQIKLNPFLLVSWPNSNYFQPGLVTSFSVTTIDHLGQITFYAEKNRNELTKEALSAIGQLDHNSKVIFDDIIVVSPNSKPRRFSPLVIRIRIV